jgi:hypothetical protein
VTAPDREPTTADLAEAASYHDIDDESDRGVNDDAGAETMVDTDADEQGLEPLLGVDDGDELRGRWHRLQAAFVDDPRRTVTEADQLVAEVMGRLAQMFADERQGLEEQWSRGQDASTEDLRVALQRYRSFFERLLAA